MIFGLVYVDSFAKVKPMGFYFSAIFVSTLNDSPCDCALIANVRGLSFRANVLAPNPFLAWMVWQPGWKQKQQKKKFHSTSLAEIRLSDKFIYFCCNRDSFWKFISLTKSILSKGRKRKKWFQLFLRNFRMSYFEIGWRPFCQNLTSNFLCSPWWKIENVCAGMCGCVCVCVCVCVREIEREKETA